MISIIGPLGCKGAAAAPGLEGDAPGLGGEAPDLPGDVGTFAPP